MENTNTNESFWIWLGGILKTRAKHEKVNLIELKATNEPLPMLLHLLPECSGIPKALPSVLDEAIKQIKLEQEALELEQKATKTSEELFT